MYWVGWLVGWLMWGHFLCGVVDLFVYADIGWIGWLVWMKVRIALLGYRIFGELWFVVWLIGGHLLWVWVALGWGYKKQFGKITFSGTRKSFISVWYNFRQDMNSSLLWLGYRPGQTILWYFPPTYTLVRQPTTILATDEVCYLYTWAPNFLFLRNAFRISQNIPALSPDDCVLSCVCTRIPKAFVVEFDKKKKISSSLTHILGYFFLIFLLKTSFAGKRPKNDCKLPGQCV